MRAFTGLGMGVLLAAALPTACSGDAERPIYQAAPGGSGGSNPNTGGTTNSGKGGATSNAGTTSDGGDTGDGGEGAAAQGGGGGAPDIDPDACGSQPAGGDGTPQTPLASIVEALETAADAGASRLVLCNAVYDEHLALVTAHSGLTIQGGFSCTDWSYDPQGESIVQPSTVGYAIEVDSVTGLTLMDVTFQAAAAVGLGNSSVAGFIRNSSSIQLTRTRFVAGHGQSGGHGQTQDFIPGDDWPNASELNGDAASDSTSSSSTTYVGGDETEVICPGGATTRGGRGGSYPPTQAGQAGLPLDIGGDAGANTSTCDDVDNAACVCVPVAGVNGGSAASGDDGDGASVSGTLGTSGWAPAAGLAGEIGPPGGGGGGGDGAYTAYTGVPPSSSWYGGGGGGAGGCGGNGGGAGKGGGASIALLVHQSTIFITGAEFVAGDGGDGGNGSAGQVGQNGGSGGTVTATSTSSPCPGGVGGKGGSGGAGGGGAGGVSAGIVWNGTAPAYDAETTFTLGSSGEPGIGGGDANDGLSGVAVNVLQASD